MKPVYLQISIQKRDTEAQRRFEIKRAKKRRSVVTNGMRVFLENSVLFLSAKNLIPVPTLQNRHRHVIQSDVGKHYGVGTIWAS